MVFFFTFYNICKYNISNFIIPQHVTFKRSTNYKLRTKTNLKVCLSYIYFIYFIYHKSQVFEQAQSYVNI